MAFPDRGLQSCVQRKTLQSATGPFSSVGSLGTMALQYTISSPAVKSMIMIRSCDAWLTSRSSIHQTFSARTKTNLTWLIHFRSTVSLTATESRSKARASTREALYNRIHKEVCRTVLREPEAVRHQATSTFSNWRPRKLCLTGTRSSVEAGPTTSGTSYS
jgi:hypothetical protein